MADDDYLIHQGFVLMLSGKTDFQVVGEADNGTEAGELRLGDCRRPTLPGELECTGGGFVERYGRSVLLPCTLAAVV